MDEDFSSIFSTSRLHRAGWKDVADERDFANRKRFCACLRNCHLDTFTRRTSARAAASVRRPSALRAERRPRAAMHRCTPWHRRGGPITTAMEMAGRGTPAASTAEDAHLRRSDRDGWPCTLQEGCRGLVHHAANSGYHLPAEASFEELLCRPLRRVEVGGAAEMRPEI